MFASFDLSPITSVCIFVKSGESCKKYAIRKKNKLLIIHQHGFRKGRSCVTQLIDVMEKWTTDLDNQKFIECIDIDFQKAFDTVLHKRLIHKLQGYGIDGCVLNRIKDFLNNRKQRVVVKLKLVQCHQWNSARQCSWSYTLIIYISDLPFLMLLKIWSNYLQMTQKSMPQ